jgi:hypothetical protein
MSNDLLNRVFAASHPRTAAARLLYVALADQCNDQGECWPGLAHLHNRTQISKRRILRLLRQFQRDGLLTVRPPRRGRKTNTYRVTPLTAHAGASEIPTTLANPGPRARGSEIPTALAIPGARARPPLAPAPPKPPITHRSTHRDETYGSTTRARGGRKIAARWRPGADARGPEGSA